MLELREYTSAELVQILHSTGNQAIERKLQSWGITFSTDRGRGSNKKYTLTAMDNPFKIYCITELNIDSRTDFYKLRNCFYYFLNDPDFRNIPDEMKEDYTDAKDQHISRASIAKYIKHISKDDRVLMNGGEYNHYFAYGKTRIFTDEKTYKEAWNLYWQLITEAKLNCIESSGVKYSSIAVSEVIKKYGGVPRKQAKPELNVFYNDQLNTLNDYVCAEIEKEVNFKSEY